MKRSKRFAALFVALCMVFSTFAFALNVYAATSDDYISGSYRGTGLSLSLNGEEGTAPITTTLNNDGTFDIASGNELVLTNDTAYDYIIQDIQAEKAYYGSDMGGVIVDTYTSEIGTVISAGSSLSIEIKDLGGGEFYTDYDRGYAFQVAFRDADSQLTGNWAYDVGYVALSAYFEVAEDNGEELSATVTRSGTLQVTTNYTARINGAYATGNAGTFLMNSSHSATYDKWAEGNVYFDYAKYPDGFGTGDNQMRLSNISTNNDSNRTWYYTTQTLVPDTYTDFWFDSISRYENGSTEPYDETVAGDSTIIDTTLRRYANGAEDIEVANPDTSIGGSIGANQVAGYTTGARYAFRMGTTGSTNEIVFSKNTKPDKGFFTMILQYESGTRGTASTADYGVLFYLNFYVYDTTPIQSVYEQYGNFIDPMTVQQDDGAYMEYLKALAQAGYYTNGRNESLFNDTEISDAADDLRSAAQAVSSKIVDRSALYDAIDRVVAFLPTENNYTAASWTDFLDALAAVQVPSIVSGDQNAIDAAVDGILAAFDYLEVESYIYDYYDALLESVYLALQDGGYCYEDAAYDAFIEALYDFIRQDDALAAELQDYLDEGKGVQYVKDRAIVARENPDENVNAHIYDLVVRVLENQTGNIVANINQVMPDLFDVLDELEYFDFAIVTQLVDLYDTLDSYDFAFTAYYMTEKGFAVGQEIYDFYVDRYEHEDQDVYDLANTSGVPNMVDGAYSYETALSVLAYYRTSKTDMDETLQELTDLFDSNQWAAYEQYYFSDGRLNPNGDINQEMALLAGIYESVIASVENGTNEFTEETYQIFKDAYDSYDGELPVNIHPDSKPDGTDISGDTSSADPSEWRRYDSLAVAEALELLAPAYEQLISTAYAEYVALYEEAMELLDRGYDYLDDAFADFEDAIALIAAPDESLSKASYALLGADIDALQDAIDTLKASSFQFGDYKAFYELYQKAEYIANVNAYDYTDDSYVEYVDAFDAWVETAEIREWLQNPAEINDGVTLNMRRDEATVNGYIDTLEALFELLVEYPFGDLSRLDVLLIAASEAVTDEEIYTDDSFESFLQLYFETLLDMDALPEEVNDGEDPDSRVDEDLVDELEIQLIRALEQLELRQLSEGSGGDSAEEGEGKVSTGDTSLLMVYVACSVAIAAIGLVLITKKKRNLDR